jgi:hypothetical protein
VPRRPAGGGACHAPAARARHDCGGSGRRHPPCPAPRDVDQSRMKPGRTAAVATLKPSDEASSGRFIGFIAHKAGGRWARGAGQGTGRQEICPRLPGRARLSRLPKGRQARADLSRDKSAKPPSDRVDQASSGRFR